MSEDQPHVEGSAEAPPTARFTRETLLGCVGLLCVLLTLPLLWLAVGSAPGWLAHALPLLAFTAAIGGAALTLRVPAALAARSSDPRRPLTQTGSEPKLERPATTANRLSSALAATLLIGAIAGYAQELAHPGSIWGLALMFAAGALLLSQGLLVGWRRLPAPALLWLRLSIYGATGRHSGLLIAAGFVASSAALFLAMLDGYAWGLVGLALLVVAIVGLAPLARRAPAPRSSRLSETEE